MDSRTRRQPRAARAFSLIELLIVVGIIVILISISLAVGLKVSSSGKVRQTEQTLRALDQSLSEMMNQLGGNPKPYVLDPRAANLNASPANQYVQPVMDGVNEEGGTINSVGLFLAQCKEIPSVYATLQTLPAKILKDYDGDDNGNESSFRNQASMPTVFDGWGNPIRYVHPAFSGLHPSDGAATFVPVFDPTAGILKAPAIVNGVQRPFGITTVRRNADEGDADGGITPGNRPYFYSCGPDGLPETVEDNIYINQPTYTRQ